MKCTTKIKLLATLIIVIIILTVIVFSSIASQDYVRGKYGTKCYEKGKEHKNIKHFIYFGSLEECLESLE